jgi:hypothetical protein
MGFLDVFKKKSVDIPIQSDGLGYDASALTRDVTGIPKSEVGYDADPNASLQTASMSAMMDNNFNQHNQFQQQPSSMMPQAQSGDMGRDLQMISLKLDAIKSEIDAMNQRIKNVEAIAEREQALQHPQQKKWY